MRSFANLLFAFLNLWMAVAAFQLDLADNGLAVWAIFLALEMIAILIHETGHAIAARSAGATVLVFAAGFFAYDFASRKFRRMPRIAGYEVGGFVAYGWMQTTATRSKEALIAAAGPGANLIAAALALAVITALAPAPPKLVPAAELVTAATNPHAAEASKTPPANLPTSAEMRQTLESVDAETKAETVRKWLDATLKIFVLLSVGFALINLLPFNGSDGDKLLKLWRKS